jgi:hypothetical protein
VDKDGLAKGNILPRHIWARNAMAFSASTHKYQPEFHTWEKSLEVTNLGVPKTIDCITNPRNTLPQRGYNPLKIVPCLPLDRLSQVKGYIRRCGRPFSIMSPTTLPQF